MSSFVKKVCLLGDGAVGKTSLIRRFVLDEFEADYSPTIGTKITKKTLDMEDAGTSVNLMIWDIMGHKSYMKVPPQYYQGTEGFMVVCDITRLENLTSLTSLDLWDNQISDIAPLENLVNLTELWLDDNNISNIEPLVNNTGLSEGDTVHLEDNPLSSESVDVYIPQLEARGVDVSY